MWNRLYGENSFAQHFHVIPETCHVEENDEGSHVVCQVKQIKLNEIQGN